MNPVHFHLEGRKVVVTGAAQGIGAACVERLVADGAAVALWDIDDALGQALAARLVASGGAATYFHCDVRRSTDVEAALLATVATFGTIDGLVNNAGIFRSADFLSATEDDWDAVIDVNLKGAFRVGQAVARQMSTTGGGAIVNMSSVNGVTAIPAIASYNASKGGVDQLTRAMALALAGHGVRVNAVAPGTIATELARQAVLGSDAARRRVLSRTPLGRLGEPAEVADACAFLLSSASSYMTGSIVYVDGGRLALNYTVDADDRADVAFGAPQTDATEVPTDEA
jgi:NAD(P)-dependent dehydrogenase (short-subunit alcohol dehydrogenase family)